MDERSTSIWVDVTFTEELESVPDAYLADRVTKCLQSPLALPHGYPWKDELAEGTVAHCHCRTYPRIRTKTVRSWWGLRCGGF
jgi:hypothetical protein